MKFIIPPQWQAFLQFNGLNDYEKIWDLSGDWVEPPNYRRGGWSGVCRMSFATPEGSSTNVYLKRQENHGHRTLLHPIRGEGTFVREFRNIRHLRKHQVPTLNPVCFAQCFRDGNLQAMLMTESLEGYRSMEDILYEGEALAMPVPQRRRLLSAVALSVRKMHASGIQHRCLYPKHLMVKAQGADYEVALIDLEKSRRVFVPFLPGMRDLGTLNRHSGALSRSDRLFFLREYLEGSPMRPYLRWLAGKIDRHSLRKEVTGQKVKGGKQAAL